MLRLFDEVTLETSGPMRVVQVEGEWYVVGLGLTVPCRNREDAEDALLYFREERRIMADTPRWVWVSLAVLCALVVAFTVLTVRAAGAQVTAEAALRDGVAELRIGNPTRSPLSVDLALFRDATLPHAPVTLGDSVERPDLAPRVHPPAGRSAGGAHQGAGGRGAGRTAPARHLVHPARCARDAPRGRRDGAHAHAADQQGAGGRAP
jgi:hypothetical protein